MTQQVEYDEYLIYLYNKFEKYIEFIQMILYNTNMVHIIIING